MAALWINDERFDILNTKLIIENNKITVGEDEIEITYFDQPLYLYIEVVPGLVSIVIS